MKVRGLQVHGAQPTRGGRPGSASAVNLGGVEVDDDRARRDARDARARSSRRGSPTRVVEVLPGAKPLRHGARVRFHQGTAEMLGRVAIVGPLRNAARQARRRRFAPGAGARAFVRLRLEAPAVLTRGDRFILRAYSPPVTIAGGLVLDPHPPRGAIRTRGGASSAAVGSTSIPRPSGREAARPARGRR